MVDAKWWALDDHHEPVAGWINGMTTVAQTDRRRCHSGSADKRCGASADAWRVDAKSAGAKLGRPDIDVLAYF